MRKILFGWMTLGLLAATAPGASAQPGNAPAARIEAARQQARVAGLPVSVLDSKIAEGAAKGIPLDRVAAAVERRLTALARAREAMGAGPRGAPVRPEDLSVGADAVEAGVSAAALGALTTAAPLAKRAVAIAVLTQLVRGGMASEQALARVSTALRGAPEALANLPARAAANARGNGPPAEPGSRGARGRGVGARRGGPPSSVPAGRGNPRRGGKP